MKKTLSLLLCILILLGISGFPAITASAATGTVLSEGFESSESIPAGWAVQDVSGHYGDWLISTGQWPEQLCPSPKSGYHMVKFNTDLTYVGDSTRLYMTSGINLGFTGEYKLSFWVYHDDCFLGRMDSIQVQTSVDNGANWSNLGDLVYRYDGSFGWKKHVARIDSASYSSNLQIAFLGTSGLGNNMYLDEISLSNDPVPVTGVSLNKTATIITVGQKEQLTATISPVDASNTGIKWTVASQSGSNVATVSSTGLVTANNPGTAVIRGASAENSALYGECTVTVAPFNGTMFSDSFEDISGPAPSGGWGVQNVTGTNGAWSIVSSGIDPNPGAPESGAKMAEFNSYSAGGSSTRLYRTSGISITSSENKLDFWVYHDTWDSNNCDYIQVQAATDGYNWVNVGYPVNRYDGSTGWKKHIVSLDQYKGSSNLRIGFLAMSLGGHNMYLDDISVTAPIVTVSLNKAAASLQVGGKETLTATVAPSNLANKKVTWRVSRQSPGNVATVSSNGIVTANNPGTAVIQATSESDPSAYAECTVTVNPIPVTGITLNKISISLAVGQAEQLTATITPANATDKGLVWEVSSQSTSNVAAVSAGGIVTGNNPGTAVIRATSVTDASIFAECTVAVYAIPVTGITLNKISTSLAVGQAEQLTATITPADATDKRVIWEVTEQSESNVATVSIDGVVTGNNLGTAVIRVTSVADSSIYAECTVTVYAVPVTSVSLNKTSAAIAVGHTEQLTATITPANATDKRVIWEVTEQSESNVATVSTNGVVTGNNPGTAVIRVTSVADSNIYAECSITVSIPVTGISLNKTSTSIAVGQTEQLTAAITPPEATDKSVVWQVYSQSASNVAAVSADGIVTANNPGTAVIRAISGADSTKYAECTVGVPEPDGTPLFSEGFEFGTNGFPAYWTSQRITGTTGTWYWESSGIHPSLSAPKFGVKMVRFNSYYASPGASTRLYRTSGLSIGNDGNYRLYFWMYHDTGYMSSADSIQVQASTDGGSSWTNVDVPVNRYDGTTGWKKHTVSLNQYKGSSSLTIAFLATGKFGNDMFLDEVSVVYTP